MREKINTLDDIQRILWNFASHRIITVAGRVGILRRLSQGECSCEILAKELDLDRIATYKIVKALHALGFLEVKEDKYFTNAGISQYFRSGDHDLTPFLEHSHSLYDSYGENLEAWVCGDSWKIRKRDQESIHKFGLAMQAMGIGVAHQVKAAIDLSEAKKMLDVGGGFGHYSRVFVSAYPQLRSTVLDTPEVVQMGSTELAGADLAERITFQGGDYLKDDWGVGYDFVLLANVLHQELSESAAGMVQKASNALLPGGRVGIVDFSIDDKQHEHVLGTLFAVNMRSFGDTYPEPTIRDWMHHSGLSNIKRFDLSDFRWLIAGCKE